VDRKTVFSGLQPTGNIHIGNYLGATRNWVRLQEDYDTIYCVVDLHAITVPYDPAEFAASRIDAARVLLAMGIDIERSLFYFQSEVPQHAELAWILGTLTPTGVLNRMTQFKEKSAEVGANLGLYAYPVLMAADILLYRADAVPVGEDQRQHLEMTRDLAARFNHRFGEEFPIPEPIIPERGARIMSLTTPTAKMSKLDLSAASRILVLDSADTIRSKIRSAVTDSGTEVRYDVAAKPGISNLLEILSIFTGRPVPDLEDEYAGAGYGKFKDGVAEAVDEALKPVRSAYADLDSGDVVRIMQKGARDARARAESLQHRVRELVGLVS